MKKTMFFCFLPLAAWAKVPDSGFYVDIGGGAASTNYYSTTGTSGVLRLDGGYNLNQIIGFQAGIQNTFSTSMNSPQLGNYNATGYAMDISVIPNIPIGQNAPVNIFFRLGLGYDTMNSTVGNMSSIVDVLGAGVRYDISAHLGISAQWIGRGLIMQPSPSGYSQNNFLATVGLYF
jgi:hypothetical protein